MNIIVCIDERGGMLFHQRRVSRDQVVILDIVNSIQEKIYMNEYSQKMFYEYGIDNSNYLKEEGTVTAYDKNKYQILKKGGDIAKLTITLLEAMESCISKEEFCNYMKKRNYEVEWTEEKKHIVFKVNDDILEGKKNRFRLENLRKTFNISDFTKEKLLERFNDNLLKELKDTKIEMVNSKVEKINFRTRKSQNINER